MKKEYISLDKLRTYQLARKLSRIGWRIYEKLDWKDKKDFLTCYKETRLVLNGLIISTLKAKNP